MTDNNTQPIDPATCEPGKWWLVNFLGGNCVGYRQSLGRWYLAGCGSAMFYDDHDVTVLAELVRRDEAQAVAEWLAHEKAFEAYGLGVKRGMSFDVRTAKSAAEYWKAECEKAQAERDEARRELNDAERECQAAQEELARVTHDRAIDPNPTSSSRLQLAEHTVEELGWTEAASLLRAERHVAEAVAAREQERDDGPAGTILSGLISTKTIAPDFDPTNPADLHQLANQLEAVNRASTSRSPDDKRCPSGLRAKAKWLRQEAAREQERDAEIAAVARRLHDNDDTTTGTIGWDELMEATRHRYRDKAEVAIAALDAVRNERGQA